MRKYKALSLICSLLLAGSSLSLAACNSSSSSDSSQKDSATAQNYTPGSYEGSAQGKGGEIKVQVSFSQDKIDKIEVLEQHETPAIGGPVFELYPQLIVDNQALGVDEVAGASITSFALKSAIAEAVDKAGGDSKALKQKKVERSFEPINDSCEVVVIGGGGAGLSAAVAAQEAGAEVILIEKGLGPAGNTARSGAAYNAVDPARQANIKAEAGEIQQLKEILNQDPSSISDPGFKQNLITLQSQINEYLKSGSNKLFDSNELHIWHTYKGGKRSALDGTEITGDYALVSHLVNNALDTLNWIDGKSDKDVSDKIGTVVGGLWARRHIFGEGGGSLFIETLKKSFLDKGGKLYTETQAKELILEGGRVVGLKGSRPDGQPVEIRASKGVVLASGGFGANAKMCKDYDQYWGILDEHMLSTNSPLITGDGIEMAKAAGADLVGMGFVQLMPSSDPNTGELGYGLWDSADNQVFINKEGKRFVNEYESRDVLTKAILKQTDGMFYIIGDQVSVNADREITQFGDRVQDLIANGNVIKADTLDELAQKLGIDPAVLKQTVDTYNSFCDTGVDTEFGKPRMGDKIDKGPFYATPRKPSIHHTMGGVKIDTSCRVLDTNNQSIPGLYAAGEVCGGIHAGNRLGGNAIPDIMVHGRTAGTSAANMT